MKHVTYIKNADPLTEVQRTSVSHGRHYWGESYFPICCIETWRKPTFLPVYLGMG
jgi:hypothetical protein